MGGIEMKSFLVITLLLGLISPSKSNTNQIERCKRNIRYAPSHKCIPHEDEISSCMDIFLKDNPHIKETFSVRDWCIRRIKVWG